MKRPLKYAYLAVGGPRAGERITRNEALDLENYYMFLSQAGVVQKLVVMFGMENHVRVVEKAVYLWCTPEDGMFASKAQAPILAFPEAANAS